jgi:hypothetical protein
VFDSGLEPSVRVGFLFSRYGYFSRVPLQFQRRIQRKNKRREKSRAGMERTYSG